MQNRFINYFNIMLDKPDVTNVTRQLYDVDRLIKNELIPFFVGNVEEIPQRLRSEITEFVQFFQADYLCRQDIRDNIRRTGNTPYCFKVAAEINKYIS